MEKDITQPLAYSYVRMSTDMQLKGHSLERQKEKSREYAIRNNLHLVENFGYTDLMVDGAPSPHQSDTTLRWLIDRLRS